MFIKQLLCQGLDIVLVEETGRECTDSSTGKHMVWEKHAQQGTQYGEVGEGFPEKVSLELDNLKLARWERGEPNTSHRKISMFKITKAIYLKQGNISEIYTKQQGNLSEKLYSRECVCSG